MPESLPTSELLRREQARADRLAAQVRTDAAELLAAANREMQLMGVIAKLGGTVPPPPRTTPEPTTGGRHRAGQEVVDRENTETTSLTADEEAKLAAGYQPGAGEGREGYPHGHASDDDEATPVVHMRLDPATVARRARDEMGRTLAAIAQATRRDIEWGRVAA
jgi:hypothetical protein